VSGARLLHVGIAVRAAEKAARAWASVGVVPSHVEVVAGEAVRVIFLSVGDAELELLEPLSPDGPVAKFVDRRGEGVHHIALAVPDLDAAVAEAKAAGYDPVGKGITAGARGSRVVFLNPKDFGGVLLELVEPAL
jgi:methylmalonyl-CoA epimerase